MSGTMTGAGLGLLGAGGIWLAVTAAPPLRRPRLDDRLAPYLRDAPRPSRLLDQSRAETTALNRLVRPVLRDVGHRLDRLLGGVASVRRRLEQAGVERSLEEFRAEQVLWGGFGLVAGLAGSLLAVARGYHRSPLALVVFCLLLAVGGVLARDRWLTRAVARREEKMLQEFPTVAELLALAVTAGEGPIGALDRVGKLAGGELARELRRALADARAGASLVQALEGVSARTGLAPLARFVDGITIAIERGTPLAEVLRAQAVDVREAGRRGLLESAGRKEIAMMVPVVFLVLPVAVVFALFPGFYGLTVTAP